MGISEKVAYLKGLMEGMNLSADSNEGKLFRAIVDVLDEIALEVEDLTDEVMELGDGLDVISDDLSDVEDVVFDEDDYEELDDEDDEDEDDEDDEDEDDEEECYATTCPECEEEIFFDDSVLEDGKVECPNCGATLEFDPADLAEDEEKDD
jgi:DNA-directed RNA polymerase subunit delta